MGVNMPARTVVFDSFEKHDGSEKRPLNPGEYVQMAGRAGRRGLDTTGTVVLLCKGPEIPQSTQLNAMITGTPTKLESQFRITYGMLLNLLRVEQLRVEDMLRRSFVENAFNKQGAARKCRLKKVERDLQLISGPDCPTCMKGNLSGYHSELREYLNLRTEILSSFQKFPHFDKMLVPGRIIIVSFGQFIRQKVALLLKRYTNSYGQQLLQFLISVPESEQFTNVHETTLLKSLNEDEQFTLDWDYESTLISDSALFGINGVRSRRSGSKSQFKVVSNVPILALVSITNKCLKVDSNIVINDWQLKEQPRFRSRSPDQLTLRLISELNDLTDEWQKSGPPLIDNFQCSELKLIEKVQRLKKLTDDLDRFQCRKCVAFVEHLMQLRSLVKLQEEQRRLKWMLSTDNLQLMTEYKGKLNVLRELGYVADDDNLVKLKGKVACEVHHMELLITELMLENKFNELTVPQVAAMLSVITCQYKATGVVDNLEPHLQKIKDDVCCAARRISQCERRCGVKSADLVDQLSFDLLKVVHEWALGVPFAQIMLLTDAQEGLIVRCIQRLDEVCRDVRNASKIVGDPSLQTKMEETSTAIKRDIVFAASLYTIE